MIFYSVENLERLYAHPSANLDERHWVDITMRGDVPTFAVTCCCDDEWVWEFWYSKRNYELVKHVIMGCMFECDDMDELINAMDDVFEECFYDIVVDEFEDDDDDEFVCNGDCENCGFYED